MQRRRGLSDGCGLQTDWKAWVLGTAVYGAGVPQRRGRAVHLPLPHARGEGGDVGNFGCVWPQPGGRCCGRRGLRLQHWGGDGAPCIHIFMYLCSHYLSVVHPMCMCTHQVLGAIGSVSGGLAIGKEGPFVHAGAAFAAIISQVPMRP